MATYFEIIDDVGLHDEPIKTLLMYKDSGAIGHVAPSLASPDYLFFLDWNSKQQTPLVLPEGWPTLGE